MRRRLLLAVCAPMAFGQIAVPGDDSLFHTSPNVAQIDALVTDAQGRPAPNLTAADFEVIRKEQPEKVLSAAYVHKERTILVVVDDLSLSPDAIDSVRAALGKFVDEQMRPNDRAAIVRTAVGVSALETFTSDKSRVRAAIDQVKCWAPRLAGPPDERTRNGFGAGSRAALEFAVGGLRQAPGRKAVVVFSSNLVMFRNALEAAVRLVNVANQAGAVLYGIDPNHDADPATAASFMVLAEQTGGAVLGSNPGLSGAMERVLGEQEGYYLIDYHPTATLALVDTEKVSVKVKREGLVVRSRTGAIGSRGDDKDTAQKTRRQQMLQALANPFSSGDIRVRLTGIFVNSAQAGSEVEALALIDTRNLGFIHYQNGRHRYGMDVAILVCAEDGRIVQENSRSFYMDMSEGDYRRAVANGLVYALNVPLRAPGAYQLRAIVGDGINGRIGFASQYLDVPDVSKQFSISSILIMGEKSTNPMSRPPGVLLDVTNENPAIRIFKPGQTFVYGYEVLNATIGADKKTGLESQIRLLRNGQLTFEGKPEPLPLASTDDPKRHFMSGRVSLSSSMEPGDYVLWVTVADKLAPDQPRQVAQYADFRVEH